MMMHSLHLNHELTVLQLDQIRVNIVEASKRSLPKRNDEWLACLRSLDGLEDALFIPSCRKAVVVNCLRWQNFKEPS